MRPLTTLGISAALCVSALAGYVLDIVWRVSVGEAEVMGKSQLIKFPTAFKFDAPPVAASLGSKTYKIDTWLGPMTVWHDKINGFQHAYGSALTAYDIGDSLSEKLFVANEWAEWFCDYNGVSSGDIHDRRRDLANNKIGRAIGLEARARGLNYSLADSYIRNRLLMALEQEKSIYTHPHDLRSLALPDEATLGCPGLPESNAFNWTATLVQKSHAIAHRGNRKAQLLACRVGNRIQKKLGRLVQKLNCCPPEFSRTS